MNDGGGTGARCGGIKVQTDTTKLPDMVVASFGDGCITDQTVQFTVLKSGLFVGYSVARMKSAWCLGFQ